MDVTEITAFVREQASIADESTEWSSAKILQLMNFVRINVFEPVITAARCGYWTHTLTRTLGQNNPIVRLPPRAAAFLQADIRKGSTGDWTPLQESTEAEQQDWERYRSGYPLAYIIRGTNMHLVPAVNDGASYDLRVKVIVRPSVLYAPQTAGAVSGVDLDTNIITLTSLPLDRITGLTITGTLNVDVIEPSDNYELSLYQAQATVLDALHVQVAAGYSLARIQIGDYLRVANQSDWPNMPESFHDSMATAAAITPCIQRDLYERADYLAKLVSSAVTRLGEHLGPRARTNTQERKPIQHSWT